LNLSFDDFIRTSADPRHRSGVEKLWATCAANGDIYKRSYSGLYCTGCEQFYKPSELNDGRCTEHGTVPEEIFEENYFFRLSQSLERLFLRKPVGERRDGKEQTDRHDRHRRHKSGAEDARPPLRHKV
jgi:methionyl-tRNA synthetase